MSMCNWIHVQWSISVIYDRFLLAKWKQCGRTSRAAWWCRTMRWQDYITTAEQMFKCKFSVWKVLWYIKSRRADFFTEWIVQVWRALVATVGEACNYIKSVDCEDCNRVQQHVNSWCRNKWAVETVIVKSGRFNRDVASSGSRRLQVFLISVSGKLQKFELILLSSPNLLLRKFDAESYEIYYWLSMLSIDRSVSRSCGGV